MKHEGHFKVLLEDTVNLSKFNSSSSTTELPRSTQPCGPIRCLVRTSSG